MRTNILLRTVVVVFVFAATAAFGQTFAPPAAQKPDIKADFAVCGATIRMSIPSRLSRYTVGGSTAAAPDERWLGVRLNLGPGWKTWRGMHSLSRSKHGQWKKPWARRAVLSTACLRQSRSKSSGAHHSQAC